MPSSVSTLTSTASRFTARPIPSLTFWPWGTRKEIGIARIELMRMCASICLVIGVDEIERPFAFQDPNHFLGGAGGHRTAGACGDPGGMRRQQQIGTTKQGTVGWEW